MARRRPTYEQISAALRELLDAFAAIDEQLDNWVAASPDGQTKDEAKEQRDAGRVREKAAKIWSRTRPSSTQSDSSVGRSAAS